MAKGYIKLYFSHHCANFASRKGFIAFSALRLFGPNCQNAEQTAVRAKQVKEWEEMTEKFKKTSRNLTFTSKCKTKNDLIETIKNSFLASPQDMTDHDGRSIRT